MSVSTIVQTIIVLAIVTVALVYVLRRIVQAHKGEDCGCGCGSKCKHHRKSKEF